jgi:hypothetical protein
LEFSKLFSLEKLIILEINMVGFKWICLILFCGNIFSNKLFYKSHFLKQNFEYVNVTISLKNTKDGILVNYYEDSKIKLDFLWVIIALFWETKFEISFEKSLTIFDLIFISVQDEIYAWRHQSDSTRQIHDDYEYNNQFL